MSKEGLATKDAKQAGERPDLWDGTSERITPDGPRRRSKGQFRLLSTVWNWALWDDCLIITLTLPVLQSRLPACLVVGTL